MPEPFSQKLLMTFKHRLFFVDDGDLPVAGVVKCSGLKRKVEAVAWREAGHPKNSQAQIAGGTTYEPITFEQGLGLDDGRFESWALSVSNWKEGEGAHDIANFRRDLRLDVMNLKGETALSYIISGAWVSEYAPLPELDGNTMNTIGIANFSVVHDGFYRQEN